MSNFYKRIKLFIWINGIASWIFYPLLKIKDFRNKKYPECYVKEISKPISVNLSNYFFNGSAYWKNFKNLKSDGLFFAEIPNATIISKGILLDSKNRVILESTIFQTEYLNRLNSNHLVFLKGFLPKKKGANVVSLLNKLDNNYFHWTLESLTRVLLIHEEPFFRDYKILIKDGALPFVKKSLKFLFNVPETNIITKTLGEKLEVKKALVVSFPHIRNVNTRMTNVYMPSVIKRLNELAHKRVNAAKLKFERLPKNFIISRKNAISRRILNEEKLIESLSYLNFEQVVLEELSFEEQVVLFVGAEKIISSHGAGITNIIYAHDPILIEIFPEERSIRDAYYFVQITGALEIEHHLFKHKTQNKKEDMVIGNTMIATFKKIFEASI